MVTTSGTDSAAGAAAEALDDGGAVVGQDRAVDGRSARRVRNREAVIQALIDLIDEGELDPTIDAIADRAAVSARSVFRYFTDLSDLARTAIETEMVAVVDLAHISGIGMGSFAERVEKLIAARLRVLQRTSRLGRVAQAKSITISEVDEGLAAAAAMSRDQVRRNFAAEFEPLDEATADGLCTSLSVALSAEAYDSMTRHLGYTDDQVMAAWRLLLHRSLG